MDVLHEMDDFDVDDADDGSSDHNFPTRLAVPKQSPIILLGLD